MFGFWSALAALHEVQEHYTRRSSSPLQGKVLKKTLLFVDSWQNAASRGLVF